MKILVFFVLGICSAASEIHRGHKVLRLTPQKNQHLLFLRGLAEQDTGIDLDFWTDPRAVGVPVDVQIGPDHQEALRAVFDEHDLPYDVMIDDVQDAIDRHMQENTAARKNSADIFDAYLTNDEIVAWLEEQAATCGSNCELVTIGDSYEGRAIYEFKITNGDGGNKPIMWIDGGIHAREWISPAVVLYFIDRLVNHRDADVDAMLADYDWYFVPLINPDGYVYTHTTDRMWRKTRRPNPGSSCVGVDANRNFDHNFGGVGTSNNPCSNTYNGQDPYDQPCTKAVSDAVMSLDNVVSFITTHSYSQLWMAPWGYTTTPPDNYDELMRVGQRAVDALRSVHGTNFRLGSASEILYQSSATSRDWAYGVPQIEYVYTLELRDTGANGFILPPEQIRPSGEEMWAALVEYYYAIGDARK